MRSFFQRSIGHLLAKAQIKPAQVLGIGVAFPDDIQQAQLPEQPPEYAAWGSVAIERLLKSAVECAGVRRE